MLVDTYYPETGTVQSSSFDSVVSCIATQPSTNTPAGCHDGLAATRDRLHLVTDASGNAYSAHLLVDWPTMISSLSYSGSISFIRYAFRAKIPTCPPGDPRIQIGFSARYDGITFGIGKDFPFETTLDSYIDFYHHLDFFGKPGGLWTTEELATHSMGYALQIFGEVNPTSPPWTPELDCEEFRIEVYSSDVTSSLISRI